LVTFEPFGSGAAGVALLTVESEPGPEVGAEVGVRAAVGPGSAVGPATGAAVVDRSGETVAGRSGALVDSGPGVAEGSGLAGLASAPEPAGVAEDPGPGGAAEDPEPIGVADGSRSAGVDAGIGVEGGCEAATWVASGDDALGTPGEREAAEDAVRSEAAGGELAAVSAEDPDRGVARTRAGVPM
jgi:hypothetical protein